MATIGKITTASSGSAAIDYAYGRNKMPAATKDWLKQQGVDPATVDRLQNRAVVMSGLNVDPEYAKTQMKATRMAFSTHGKQTTRVIQSFPTTDLDPASHEDWQTANQLGLELAKQAFPDYQVAVYTQLDGQGHKLHNHIIVNMPNLKSGEKYHEHQSWQRLSRINDEISQEHNLSIIDRNTRAPERRTMAERQLDAKNEYVWKDDLRSRIDKAILDSSTSSYKSFSERLAQSGIIIHDRGKNFSYEFLGADKKHRRARGKALGADYEKETILNELERQNRQPATELPRLAEPSRQIKQREQSTEQRKQHLESRKPAIIQSDQSVDRLTISIGRSRQTAKTVANSLNGQNSRKRQLTDRIKIFGQALSNLAGQAKHFIQRLDRYNQTVKNFQQRLKADQQAKQQAFQSFQQRLKADQKIQKQHEFEQRQLDKSFPIEEDHGIER